jgi:hypothetical protein
MPSSSPYGHWQGESFGEKWHNYGARDPLTQWGSANTPGWIKDPAHALLRGLGRKRRSGGGEAAAQFADLTRQEWQEYVSQFIPLENQLIDYASNPEEVTQAVERARESVGSAFEAQEGAMQRGLRGRQITLTPDEQAAAGRERNLSRSLADVQAANLAREQTVGRQRSILGQPMPVADVPAGLGG